MKELIEKINDIKSTGAFEYAVAAALEANNGTLSDALTVAIQKKLEELKVYSGMFIASNYNYDSDIYYFLLLNEQGLEQCVIYNENDYHKLKDKLPDIDTNLPITITGTGILKQGSSQIKFNTALNTEYIDLYPDMI